MTLEELQTLRNPKLHPVALPTLQLCHTEAQFSFCSEKQEMRVVLARVILTFEKLCADKRICL